jgi:hypothetical protein
MRRAIAEKIKIGGKKIEITQLGCHICCYALRVVE